METATQTLNSTTAGALASPEKKKRERHPIWDTQFAFWIVMLPTAFVTFSIFMALR